MDSTALLILSLSTIIALVAGVWVGFKLGKKSDDGRETVGKDLYDRELQNAAEAKREAEQLRDQIVQLNRSLSAFEQEKKDFERRINEHNAEVSSLRDEFYKQFKLTASEILEKNTESFKLKSSEQMSTILNPLNEKLKSFEQKVQDSYEKGMKERESLKTVVEQLSLQNKSLSQEAQNLTKALKGEVKTQGNWGEVILERLLESSGLKKDVEYFIQDSHTSEEGNRLQPDVVVQLPEEKYVVIDSKVSLVAYDKLAAADNKEDADQALKELQLSLKAHIKGLSDKEYQKLHGDRSPDFVLLFIPIEGAFNAALQFNNNLYQEALDKNVIIVSTTTLLATLRTIASIWKQEYQNQHIRQIADEGANLYDKIAGFVVDLEKLGSQMETTQKTYDAAMNKLSTGRGNILRRAEKMRKLGLQPTKRINPKLLGGDENEDTDELDN